MEIIPAARFISLLPRTSLGERRYRVLLVSQDVKEKRNVVLADDKHDFFLFFSQQLEDKKNECC